MPLSLRRLHLQRCGKKVLAFIGPVLLVMKRKPYYARLAADIFHDVNLTVQKVVRSPRGREHPESRPGSPACRKFGAHLNLPVCPGTLCSQPRGDVFLAVKRRIKFVCRQNKVTVLHFGDDLVIIGLVNIVLLLVVTPSGTTSLENPAVRRKRPRLSVSRLFIELIGPDKAVFACTLIFLVRSVPVRFLEIFGVFSHASRQRRAEQRQEYHIYQISSSHITSLFLRNKSEIP